MAEQFVAKVIDVVEPGQSLHQVVSHVMNPQDITPHQEALFKNLMENHKVSIAPHPESNIRGQLPSLIEEVQQLHNKIRVTEFTNQSPAQFKQNIHAFADKSIAQMDAGKNFLLSRDLNIKPSVGQVLQNKLTNVRTDMRSINQTLHLEFPETTEAPGAKLLKPLQKFFGYLIDGQVQMQQLKENVNNISNENFSVSDMLRVQLKMAHVSQELEFFTSLLNKSLESTKTLMNVQI